MKFNKETCKLEGIDRHIRIAAIMAVVGFVLSLIGIFVDSKTFFHSYLTAFAFWVTLACGGLFMVMLHHLTGSVWSIVVRRISESAMMTLPVLALFFIPIMLGLGDLYPWTENYQAAAEHHAADISLVPEAHAESGEEHEDAVHEDVIAEAHAEHDPHADLMAKKKGYLNQPFFIIRAIIYLAVWSLLAFMLYRHSLAEDREGYSEARAKKMRAISAPGMIAFALTISFAGYDWLMSLDPLWYSTIYGVYFFSGGIVAIMASMSIVLWKLNGKGMLGDYIGVEHYHTIGKLLFGFVIFWSYMAFSQYLLIWYANIPEETAWYHHRWVGGWKAVTVILALGHFVIPFVGLMSAHVKRNINALAFFAGWIMTMHWIDLYWNIQPNLYPDGAGFSWMNVSSMMTVGGVFMYLFWRRYSSNALVPVNDPRLEESIRYVN